MSIGRWADKPWMRPTMYTSESDQSLRDRQQPGERTAGDVEALIAGDSYTGRDGHMPHPDLGDGRPDPSRVDDTPMIYRDAQFSRERALDLDDREEPDVPLQQYEEYKPVPKPDPFSDNWYEENKPVINVNERPKALAPVARPESLLAIEKLDTIVSKPVAEAVSSTGDLAKLSLDALRSEVGPEDLGKKLFEKNLFKAVREAEDRNSAPPHLADPKPDIMLATKLLGVYPTKGGGVLVDVWISGMSARVTPDDLEAVANEFLIWARVARIIKV